MADLQRLVQQQISESITVQQQLAQEQVGTIVQMSEVLIRVLRGGGTLYLCGNGGSAADAQHVAAELVGRYLSERRALPAVALTTNTSILTAIGNDYDFSQIFARQVRALVTPRDAVAGISTSGESLNVLEALRAAREIGATTLGFTGAPGQPLAAEVEIGLCVPSPQTPRIQEAHILAWHIICDLVEQALCDETP